ncbi:MAG: hypothetical protein HY730_00240 [Candidatus Tectomicrobia bacterium]|uniref:Uncharacterized protein n=1 Tax=Tectimicrobiota bacterium TaxID=2528274 RepID=A0A933GL45_UNCTE|nr:hypothetical protein [Candidatus Tectomicrobia bacterium]
MFKRFSMGKREALPKEGARRLFKAGLNSLTKKLLASGCKKEKQNLPVKTKLLA